MRRQDRAIENTEEIISVLEKCDTLSIGFHGEAYPYVVPVSFGFVRKGDSILIYFHGAKQGQKIDCIESDPRVCVEGHVFHKVEPTQGGITTRYESFIGFGVVEKADANETVLGLRSIVAHNQRSDHPIENCKGLSMTAVYKITVERFTGKRNLP